MGFFNCCCCEIGTDRFSANDGRPHAGWTYDDYYSTPAGDKPTNTSNEYYFAKAAIEIFDTSHPDGAPGKSSVYVELKLEDSVPVDGVSGGIIVGWLDNTTCLYVVLHWGQTDGCNYLEFWAADTIAGLHYIIGRMPLEGLALGDWHKLRVCHIPDTYGTYGTWDTLRAWVQVADTTITPQGRQFYAKGWDESGFDGGAQVGLIVNNDDHGNGHVHFRNFKFQYFKETPDHQSCPNCNTPCPIFTDTMEHGDIAMDSTLVSDEQSGGTLINPFYALTCFYGVLAGTARFADTGAIQWLEIDAGGRVMVRKPHPQGKTAKIWSQGVYWETGVIFNLDTGSGYAQFDPDAGEIRLYDNDDNLLATRSGLATADDDYKTATICYAAGVLTASLQGFNGGSITNLESCIDVESPDTGDPYIYLESVSGTAHFRELEFQKHKDLSEPKDSKCEECECINTCNNCLTNQTPRHWKLVIPTLTSGSCDCSGLPTSFILNPNDEASSTNCIFVRGFTSCLGTVASLAELVVRILSPSDTDADGIVADPHGYLITISLFGQTAGGNVLRFQWAKDFGATKPDCLNFQDEEFPLTYSQGSLCDTSDPSYLTAV